MKVQSLTLHYYEHFRGHLFKNICSVSSYVFFNNQSIIAYMLGPGSLYSIGYASEHHHELPRKCLVKCPANDWELCTAPRSKVLGDVEHFYGDTLSEINDDKLVYETYLIESVGP